MNIVWGILLAPLVAQAQTPARSMQQVFDEATLAAVSGKCADAIRDFESIEALPAAKRNPLVANMIALRKGQCLIKSARADEGEALVRQGLSYLASQGPDYAGDRLNAASLLGDLAAARFDYADAIVLYRAALAEATGSQRIGPLIALARLTMFDDGPEALAFADEAIAIAAATPDITKDQRAVIETLRARVLLNRGDKAQAYRELKGAVEKQGGLTLRTTASEVVTRYDAALAASLNNDAQNARRYLAYTGAGRTGTPFSSVVNVDVPLCSGEDGLRPDDVAVMSFSVSEEGVTRDITPIYTNGGRQAAIAFGKAVASWSWEPEALAKIDPFFRRNIRVELRCSRSGQRPSLYAPLDEATELWFASQGLPQPVDFSAGQARAVAQMRATLQGGGGDDRQNLAALVLLSASGLVPDTERLQYFDRAVAAARAAQAPTAVMTRILLLRPLDDDGAKRNGPYRTALRALLADEAVARDPLSRATIRMLLAVAGRTPEPDAAQLLAAVADEPELPQSHPLRVAALLRTADLQARSGNLDLAQATFARTGLTEQQCAVLGVRPAMKRSGVGSYDYPAEALSMGFEGWTQIEFDIDAEGKPQAPRATAAFPPFVFSEIAGVMGRQARFERSFRPDGESVACAANRQRFVFKIPK